MVDEIILLDITATKDKKTPNYNKIEEICSEAFMPFAYGGGIRTMGQVDLLFKLGIEKVVLNTILGENLSFVKQISDKYGAQSIVGSIDVKTSIFGKQIVYTNAGSKKIKISLDEYLSNVLNAGVGEIFINSIDLDGTYLGYNVELIRRVSKGSNVPIIVCGGANSRESFDVAFKNGASAAAAGSLFVYSKQGKGILINYPSIKL